MVVNLKLYRIVVKISLDGNLDKVLEKNLHYYDNIIRFSKI